MSLIILTKSPQTKLFSKENIRSFLKFILNKKRGPSSVTSSLIRGLEYVNFDFKLNPKAQEIKDSDTIFINESLEALKWSLNFKKNNKIVAGPNLVILPTDENSIICDEKINIILEPSEWVKELIISLKPDLAAKIRVWAAGVHIPLAHTTEKKYYLIYLKNIENKELIDGIKKELIKNKLNYRIIQYGKFKQEKYFSELNNSIGLIYLAKTESQGLALQEAWARNVPTMVLECDSFKYKDLNFKHRNMAAPYLEEQNGIFFNPENFDNQLNYFINNLEKFTPKEYVLNKLSDEICVNKFLDIIR